MSHLVLAFVLTEAPVTLDGEAWAAACRSLGVAATGAGGGTTASVAWGDGVEVQAGAMPAAVPGLAEDDPRSLLWPDASAFVAAHRGHVVVVASGDDPVRVRQDLACAATALALALGAPGLVWADQTWLVATPFARALVQGGDGELPVALWVAVDLARLPGGQLSALTRGLDALGHPDLWFSSPTMTPWELADTVWSVAGWLVQTGTTLAPGETLGRDADERLPISLVPAPDGRGADVVRVVYP